MTTFNFFIKNPRKNTSRKEYFTQKVKPIIFLSINLCLKTIHVRACTADSAHTFTDEYNGKRDVCMVAKKA